MNQSSNSGAAGEKISVRLVCIDPERAGQRIDNFLMSQLKGVPKTHVYRLLRTGQVRVNKGRIRQDYRLRGGDIVRIPPVRQAASSPGAVPGGDWAGRLHDWTVFEDDAIWVINKPSGLAVHGGSGLSHGLIEAARVARPRLRTLELAHRLDRETSGCLILAKKRSALRELARMLRDKQIHKVYSLLVRGRWPPKPVAIDHPLKRNVLRSGERIVTPAADGKSANTRFRPLCLGDRASLVRAAPATGRTHQIRVHAKAAGHPIAGDEKYGDADFNTAMRAAGLKRLFLHAAGLNLRHPLSGEPLRLQAPLPDELLAVLRALGLSAQ